MITSQHDDRPQTAHPQLILPAVSANPASLSSTAASSPSVSALDPPSRKGSVTKRKRGVDIASDSTDSTAQTTTTRTRDGPKKKKANRACFHCQKAHLTCDDSRPCQRCIKRGMADNCTEGHRKKAKYLLDDEELEALKRSKSGGDSSKNADQTPHPPRKDLSFPSHTIRPLTLPPHQAPRPHEPYIPQPESIFSTYDPTSSYSYGPTDAANLEYSIISSILGNTPEPGASATAGSPSSGAPPVPSRQQSASYVNPQSTSGLVTASWPAEPMQPSFSANTTNGYGAVPPGSYQHPQTQQPLSIQPSETPMPSSSGSAGPSAYMRTTPSSTFPSTTFPSTQPSAGEPNHLQYPSFSHPQQDTQQSGPSSTLQNYAGQASQTLSTNPSQAVQSFVPRPRVMTSTAPGIDRSRSTGTGTPTSWGAPPGPPSLSSASDMTVVTGGFGSTDGSSVYKSVTKGYDYTEGYHFLMKHLCFRGFEKNDILRIVRALAIFRPSLIALQMPLTEEDEVFVEKCFQRSLVELDKLVSFSGTPTVAWRRTGEICLVGPEFCMLTGWEKEELTGRRKYIYELFENQSVVEYWENFANHAFENTTQSVFSHCVLLKPNGAPVPCTFCFSIRRDIMDLPSLVIGQWLPLL